MSILDRLGKKAMDVIDAASRAAEDARERVAPLVEKTPFGLRRRRTPLRIEVPEPEPNESPFSTSEPADDAPLGSTDKAAEVFGPGTDPWTGRSLQLLSDHQIEHAFIDLEDEANQKVEARLIRQTRQSSPPYVFLRGEFIGGFNALSEIQRLGQLEVRTTPKGERGEGDGRLRIVIPTRTENEAPEGERGLPDDRK
jgi:glutaredoxin